MKKDVLPKQQKVKEERIGSKINHFWIWKEIKHCISRRAVPWTYRLRKHRTVLQVSNAHSSLSYPHRAIGSIEFTICCLVEVQREDPWDGLDDTWLMGHQWQCHSAQRQEKMLLAMGQFDWSELSDLKLLNKHPLGCPYSALNLTGADSQPLNPPQS